MLEEVDNCGYKNKLEVSSIGEKWCDCQRPNQLVIINYNEDCYHIHGT